MSRSYDGSNTGTNQQYVKVLPNAAINTLPSLTYAAWVYLKSGRPIGSFQIFEKDTKFITTPRLSAQNIDSTHLILSALVTTNPGTAVADTSTTIAQDTWNHVAMTWDSVLGIIHIYINGIEASYLDNIASANPPRNDSGSGDPAAGWFVIGSDVRNSIEWNGYIAEVAIWNVKLSPSDVSKIAASTTGYLGVAATDPVGYWHLCGTASPEPDVSGNGNNGILSSNPPTLGPDSPGFNCNPPVTVNRIHNIDAILDKGALPGMIVQPNNFQSSLPRAPIFQQIVTKPVRFLRTVIKTLSGG